MEPELGLKPISMPTNFIWSISEMSSPPKEQFYYTASLSFPVTVAQPKTFSSETFFF